MLVLPVLARPCAWKLISWLASRQVRPQDGRPLSAASEVDIDADLTALTYEIASLVNRIDGFRLTKHMVGGVGAGLAGFDGWLFPGEPRRWR